MGVSTNSATYNAKIGLMCASDYGFVATPAAWTTKLYIYEKNVNDSSIKSLNWLYLGSSEWIITPNEEFDGFSFYVYSSDSVGYLFVGNSYAIRPAFYLSSTTFYDGVVVL